jgi:hypothetical protein
MVDPHVVYVDDSGTDGKAKIVIAAFCVSTVERWLEFGEKWKRIADHAGFGHFHMTEFAACRRTKWCPQCRDGKTSLADHPWRVWPTEKRKKVLNRLAKTVTKYVEYGVGLSHTKEDYEEHVHNSPARLVATEPIGDKHFTFCVQRCGGELAKWRAVRNISTPLEFVFDLTPDKQRDEITHVFFGAVGGKQQYQDGVEQWFKPVRVAFESRQSVVQLLAADMLAWESARLRALQVFGRGSFEEARQLGYIFTSTRHIRMGYTPKEALMEWERKTLRGVSSR